MKTEEILTLERTGIIKTINSYTRENFIINYLDLFSKMSYPEDKEDLKKVSERLIEWYKKNMKEIEKNQFIYNKHEHKRSFILLENLFNNLNH